MWSVEHRASEACRNRCFRFWTVSLVSGSRQTGRVSEQLHLSQTLIVFKLQVCSERGDGSKPSGHMTLSASLRHRRMSHSIVFGQLLKICGGLTAAFLDSAATSRVRGSCCLSPNPYNSSLCPNCLFACFFFLLNQENLKISNLVFLKIHMAYIAVPLNTNKLTSLLLYPKTIR